MWAAYFDTILANMLNYESLDNELLIAYNLHEGWYYESPWEIKDISEVIMLFKNFDVNKKPDNIKQQSGTLISRLPELLEELILFFEEALERKEKFYIIYE